MDYKILTKDEIIEDIPEEEFILVSKSPEDDECLILQEVKQGELVGEPLGEGGEFCDGDIENTISKYVEGKNVYVSEDAEESFETQMARSEIYEECDENISKMAEYFDEMEEKAELEAELNEFYGISDEDSSND
ncbi:MAG: hypothetical protein IJ890_07800 [Clostridia bacterium]|nr:hypothetical protein [Clostridia bacterium]